MRKTILAGFLFILACGCYVAPVAPPDAPIEQKVQKLDFEGWDAETCRDFFAKQVKERNEWHFDFIMSAAAYVQVRFDVNSDGDVVVGGLLNHPVVDQEFQIREIIGEKFRWKSGCTFDVDSPFNVFYGKMRWKDKKTTDVVLVGQWRNFQGQVFPFPTR